MLLRHQVDLGNPNTPSVNVCDFIDDYRSGTVFDVIGSVGGLFALLQAAHVLLFGRPLLWGLTGAKLITPFGLFGACSSRGFKRRLKDEYHGKSAEDGSDTIQVVRFLRDFVIEFGPADLDPECPSSHQPVTSPTSAVAKEDDASIRIPLMAMNSDVAPMHQRDSENDNGASQGNGRVNSTV
ncbi:hypothetical protein B0J17DRAFT_717932 [Rhizoctonia solani]|nr:hypothetical protein B0J17DRAFT_717932 [Rhizoctonia solani]